MLGYLLNTLAEGEMKKEKVLRVTEVTALTGFQRKRLKLWEEYGLLSPARADNHNEDRLYSQEDVEFIKWAGGLMKKGLSADSIRILKEYFETGSIKSYKWFK